MTHASRGFVTMRSGRVELTKQKLDAIAWKFLGSEFTGQIYAGWPIDRRVDAYLLRQGLIDVANDGGASNALLERVMANIGRALGDGLLSAPHR
ncbi:MAG: hypothetical protein ACLP9Y_29115 [Mycobacterium sp.]|uniref:hypothetical protein n=1 Tax=Mycobacterium sp. TaxID=1785 RepID=UPI003F96374F